MISFEAVASPDQAGELRQLRNECREYMTGSQAVITPQRQKEFLDTQIRPGRVHAWLLRMDGDAVAYALLRPGKRGELWMSCGVGEAHRGKGTGTLVVNLVTAMGHHLSPGRPVRLEVWRDNFAARRTYLKAGWAEDGRNARVQAGRVAETMMHE